MGVATTRSAAGTGSAAMQASIAPRIGRVIGSYRLVTELGQGGMGTVYYAEHVTLARRAAVKVLDPDVARNADLVARFFDEARAVNRIHHAGIVDVFDLGTEDGLHFLVMELLEGETLGARLERVGKLSPADAIRILAQTCDALIAAHERGIVHRDLKPENLFLSKTAAGENVKVLDFGIAKLTGQEDVRRTQTGLVLGTPRYMSPEQCLGERDLDARSDVYSLGVVAFEAVTGRPPFIAESVGRLIVAHTSEPPPQPTSLEPTLPLGVEEILVRALAKRREDRYGTMRELRCALDTALVPRVPAHLAVGLRGGALPSPEEIVRIEIAQTRAVGGRLREIIHARLESDRLPLPAMPMAVMRALDLLRDEHAGMAQVARALETDPLVVPSVLRLANSAAHGAAVPIASLDHAVARLGARALRTLLTESAARDLFRSRDPAIARSFRAIWEHCVAVATLGRALGAGSPVAPDEIYLTGLLHDVGKPVLGVLLLETERSLLAKLGAPAIGGSLWMRIIEDSHAEVGAKLAKRWKLPSAIVRVIGGSVEATDPNDLGSWLAYAHALAVSVGHTGGVPIPEGAVDALGKARERMGGSAEREEAALALLRDVLAPASQERAPRPTVTRRRRTA